ncbi:MAG: hypothetical protein GY797_08045 [Deltaproteobacteria bacterium]|nr:hypothetical protein [Deltaproteobacteria bacterium]
MFKNLRLPTTIHTYLIGLSLVLATQLFFVTFNKIDASSSKVSLKEPNVILVRMTRLEQQRPPDETDPIIHTINFQNYLRVVLPNEWAANWQNSDGTPESLRTGAVAVRTFGWYRVNNPLSTSPFYHVTDRSQDYDPNDPASNHPNTNQAIADTLGVYISHNSQPIRAEFRADTGNPTFNSENDPVVSLPFL